MPSSSLIPARPGRPSASRIREKLPPERIALMRDWVECTAYSFKRIGQELGVSASTICRYATEGGWKRPDRAAPTPHIARPNPGTRRQEEPGGQEEPGRQETNAGPQAADPIARSVHAEPPQPGDRRERIAQKLWTLAERHAEILETQPIERAQRSLQPLARLTRTLGEIDKHVRAPLPAHEYEIDAPRPRRSLHELRDELAAHLERINREEGYGWEVREWWFEGGGGI